MVHTIGLSVSGLRTPLKTYLVWGIVAMVLYTLLLFHSFRWIRNIAYEFFLVSHIVMAALYLAACWLHWAKMSYWVYVSH